MSILEICTLLERSGFGTEIRESSVLFPIIEGIHVLGLSLSVGLIIVSDLRLAGVILCKRSASEVWAQFFPWMMSGFAIMIVSGALLFWSHALAAYNSFAFRAKLVLLILAALNAAIYHSTIYRRMDQWDTNRTPPLGARFAGWVSILLWMTIITMGRIMAYSF